MHEPIANMLTGGRLDVARLQDLIMDIIYDSADPEAMLYGGTAIWRCYEGNRFSEDIDIYTKPSFTDAFEDALERHSLRITWRDPELHSHVKVSDGKSTVLVEASHGSAESDMRQYVRVDGTTAMISVLSPTELLVRKIEAYEGRRYIRDIYDIMQLTGFLDKTDYTVSSRLGAFLKNVTVPEDEQILSSLIYRGTANLNFKQIVEYIRRWLGEV